MIDVKAIGKGLIEKINAVQESSDERVCGRIVYSGDGVVRISGLHDARYNELLQVHGGYYALALNLEEKEVGAVLFSGEDKVRYGDLVYSTGQTVQMPVGEAMLGRIVDPLGKPIDGLDAIETSETRPVEFPAPAIMDRGKVNKPLQTGILAIDSMIPIGRGQRELIIGDRQTGKTAIAVDAILNQKGKGVVCIYVAIGQKAGSVARLVETLRKNGAMDYTIVLNAGAGESAPMQYIAPYAGCAMAEYFMYAGRDVLIVYDDLSKHAVAYRTLSLLLERAPGREAYPGDVFYLHSRLLERAAHLSDELGGGSITALPIVETQAGDVSAYIPTNVISITDGQIFLESELFFEGQRPAVNIGLSVSRVGGAAQTKAVKRAVGSLRLDLAQYREMEVFMQFASDLDELTRKQLYYGQGLMRLLRQPQSRPYSQAQEVLLLTAALGRRFADVPVDRVNDCADKMLEFFATHKPALFARAGEPEELSAQTKQEILSAADEFLAAYNAK